jgi:hypothetical protein
MRLKMNQQDNNPGFNNDLPRCQHRTCTGRRCRQSVSDSATGLCSKHSNARHNYHDSATTAFLTDGLTEFKSPESINEFLSRLLLALAEERIAPRRAAVLAYITNQLLHSQRAIERNALAQSGQDESPEIIIDLPRPQRDYPGENPS